MLKVYSGGINIVRGIHIDQIAQALANDEPVALCLSVPIDDVHHEQFLLLILMSRLVDVHAPHFQATKPQRINLPPINGRVGIWITIRRKKLTHMSTESEGPL